MCLLILCINLWTSPELAWSKSADGKLRTRHISLPDEWQKPPNHIASFFSDGGGVTLLRENKSQGQRSEVMSLLDGEARERKLSLFSFSCPISLNLISLLLCSIPKYCFLSISIFTLSYVIPFYYCLLQHPIYLFLVMLFTVLFVLASSSTFSRNLLLVTTCLLTNSGLLEEMLN